MKFSMYLACLAATACSYQAGAEEMKYADQVFIGDNIITMESPADRPKALAIHDGVIIFTGTEKDAQRYISPDTKVTKLGSQALLPGFIDAHGHITTLAITESVANLAPPPVGKVTDMKSLQSELLAYIEKNNIKPGEIVAGMGYDDSLMAEHRYPTREDLDLVSKESPVIIAHVSGHLASVNSKALDAIGYTENTPDPEGGVIRHYPGSKVPNGVLEENAIYPARQLAAKVFKDPVGSLRKALDVAASYGITTFQDGRSTPDNMKLLNLAASKKLLTMDIVAYPEASHENYQSLLGIYSGKYNNRLKVGGIKLVLDGSPQGKTAYLSKPYFEIPHGHLESYRGYPRIPEPEVKEMVAAFLKNGVPVIAHCNGDSAAEMLIDAVEDAHPTSDHRTVMIHAQTVREDQLDRMVTNSIIPSFYSAHVFYWGDWYTDSVLGPDRAQNISPTKSALKRHMKFTVHNDSPVVPPDMIRLLWATVNRETRSGKVLGPEQRISVYEALQAVTSNAAYQYFEENSKGTLAVGKQADLVVLSQDPLAMNEHDLLSLKVEETWSRGNRIYKR